MKPELLLLIQLLAKAEANTTTMLDTLSLIACRIDGLPDDAVQTLSRKLASDSASLSQRLFEQYVSILRLYYPEVFGAETIEELLKKISLS